MIKEYNVKANFPTVAEAIGLVEIEIDMCKREGINLLKVIHGYGSSGSGGAICLAIKNQVKVWKKQNIIKDYLFGVEWNGLNPKACKIMLDNPDLPMDRDFNHSNMGMTILVLN